MHCRSCEILIEDELKKVNGVKSVYVNHKTGIAEVECECELDQDEVNRAVEEAGYSTGEEGRLPFVSTNKKDYLDLGLAFFIVFIVYLTAKTFGIFELGKLTGGGNYSSLPFVFMVGLTAGISTCMALVGGLVLGAAARFSSRHPQATGIEKFTPHLYFNVGRVVSYFILGGVLGFLGSLFQLSTSVLGVLTVAAGLVMLVLGGQLIDIFPFLKRVSFTLPKSVSRALGIKTQAADQYSHTGSALMGASTFFLPCGFTQAMQLFAMSSGSPITGALTMGVFALGTAPGLLGIGGITSVVKGKKARLFFKGAGVVVILLSLFNITNGLTLMGVSPNVLGATTIRAEAGTNNTDSNVKLVNGVQEVYMNQESGGYRPNRFTVKQGIPVKWIINSKDIYTCAASIVSPQLNIRKGLQRGENIIEFTPDQVGTIRFSCSMGMFAGSFTVIENSEVKQSVKSVPSVVPSPTPVNKVSPVAGKAQVIKAAYTLQEDIVPSVFTVKVNRPVRFEIAARDNGEGCMGTVAIPGLSDRVEMFSQGQNTVFEFTPGSVGTFPITCAMGVPRGYIEVIE